MRPERQAPLPKKNDDRPVSVGRHDAAAEVSAAELRAMISAAQGGLLGMQQDDGHWCAELEGDTILESEYALALYFLGLAEPSKIEGLAATVRTTQLEDGGWANFPGGAPEVSVSVKSYLLLKLAGDDPEAPHMVGARQTIRRLGGLEACNSFTKIYLSIFGLYDWRRCPAVPPEMILLPRWFYFNIYAMSSWSRAIVVPLSIIWAKKPRCVLPAAGHLDDIADSEPAPKPRYASRKERYWSLFFRAVNQLQHVGERLGLVPLRARAIRRGERWTLERLVESDGVGAIFPPIINTLIAFRSIGYDMDHAVMQGQIHELEKLEVWDGPCLRVQPCCSPIWDTALAVDALAESGMATDDPSIRAAGQWLLDREVDRPGDAQMICPDIPVGGWFFEYRNVFYPDCDDTGEVLKALSRVRFERAGEQRELEQSIERGLAWLRGMQNSDGGWAAFDRGCDREILTYVPFADHNAMIDPSTSDITARLVEVMMHLEVDPQAPEIQRAVAFLRAEQEADGSWYGRWGCNYIYGTWLALGALSAVGDPDDQDRIELAAAWFRSIQNEDGGWGELPDSYDDERNKGRGPSTAAQTAWALMGLLAAGDHPTAPHMTRAVAFLRDRQRDDGTWYDEHWTGTGFPRVFYLRYHLYATYFPLGALSTLERRLVRMEEEPVARRRGVEQAA